MDITSAYMQIPIKESDILKTAFVTKSRLFEFVIMPFGLSNAPATFQRTVLGMGVDEKKQLALSGLQWVSCLIFLDDVIVYGIFFKEHRERLQEVLERVRQARLKLKPKKCHFFQSEVAFLGHIISEDGVRPN